MASRSLPRPAARLLGLGFAFGLWVFPVQAGHLISGPMLGYVEHREALIWLEVKEADTVSLTCWPEERPFDVSTRPTNSDGPTPSTRRT